MKNIGICTEHRTEAAVLEIYFRRVCREEAAAVVSCYGEDQLMWRHSSLLQMDLMVFGLLRKYSGWYRAEGYYCSLACVRQGFKPLIIGPSLEKDLNSAVYWNPGSHDTLWERSQKVISLSLDEVAEELHLLKPYVDWWLHPPVTHG